MRAARLWRGRKISLDNEERGGGWWNGGVIWVRLKGMGVVVHL